MQSTVRPYDADRCVDEVKANEQPGDWWEPLNMTVDNADYEVIKWPSVHWAGWYDIFLTGQLIAFDGFSKHAAPGKRLSNHGRAGAARICNFRVLSLTPPPRTQATTTTLSSSSIRWGTARRAQASSLGTRLRGAVRCRC